MSTQIKFTLDGREVAAAPGETIWEVAKREGTVIPHLCHKDQTGYRPDGNCRACVVEIEGERVLAASCCRNPSNGMVGEDRQRAGDEVAQDGDGAAGRRSAGTARTAHDKSAHFWDMAEASGVHDSRFPKLEAGRIPLLDDSHVAMRVNLDACIQCGLCVRACREVQVNDVIGMADRGHDAYPVFDFDDPMGAIHLRRLRRMRAGLPDRRADAGDRARRRAGRRPGRFRQRDHLGLPVLRRRLPGLAEGEGRQGQIYRGHQRPRERRSALRQGPLRLRLHPPPRTG